MRTLHIPVSMAACLAVVLGASVSSADEKKAQPPAQQPVTVQPAQPVQPAQQQPMQAPTPTGQQPNVIIVQPPAQQATKQGEQVGTTQTTAAPYRRNEPAAERTESTLPNTNLLSTGIGLAALSYAPAAVVATISPRSEDKRLYIPVAGPWLDLANRGAERGGNETVNKAMIITSGAVQGAGALMAIGSLLIPETKTVPTKAAAEVEKPSVKVVPIVGAFTGIGAMGRF